MSDLLHFAEYTLQELALGFMALVYITRLTWLLRFKAGRERQAPTGTGDTNPRRSVLYSWANVALPNAKPGITVAFIRAVIFSWNNFVFHVVLAGRETRTLPVAVYNMLSFEQLSWGPLAATALTVTVSSAWIWAHLPIWRSRWTSKSCPR